MSNTISIRYDQLPTGYITPELVPALGEDVWIHKCEYDSDGVSVVNLTETEIHEFTAKALKELQRTEDELREARDRVDALRMFVRKLYDEQSLKLVSGE